MASTLISALLRVSEHGLLVLRPVRDSSGNICDFLCTHANAAAALCLGIAESALVGKSASESVTAFADPTLIQAWVTTALRGLPDQRELTVASAQGIRKLRVSSAQAEDSIVLGIVDLTELEALQHQRRASDRVLATLFETVPQPMFVKDRDGRYTSVNRAMVELWRQTPEQILGQVAVGGALRPRDEAQLTEGSDRQVLETGTPQEVERLSTFPDGSRHTIRIRKAPLRGDQGEVVGLVGVVEDLTSERATLESLRLSEQFLRNVVEASLQGIAIVQDGRVVFANEAYAAMFGYSSPDELMQVGSVTDLVTAEEAIRLSSMAEARLAGTPVPDRYEMECKRKDGSLFWVYVMVRVVEWKGRPASQAAFVDISDRKRAEMALRESERALRTAQAVAHIGSWSVQVGQPGTLRWSDETLRIFGVRPEEFDGKVETALRRVHRDDRKRFVAQLIDVVQKRIGYFSEHRIVRPDGTVRWVHEQAEYQAGIAQENGRYVGVVQDITERKASELALEASERQLRNILEGALHGIAVGQDDRVVFINPVGASLHGYDSPAEIVGQPIGNFVPPEYRPLWAVKPNIIRSGKFALDEWEVEYLRKDGSRFWVLVRGKQVEWQGRPAFQVSFMDISDRKAAQDALSLAHARIEDAIESIPGGFALYDENGRLILCNSKTARIWPELGLQWRPGTPFAVTFRAILGAVEGLVGATLEARLDTLVGLFRNRSGSFEIQSPDRRILQWHSSRGVSGGTILLGLDVTDERHREEQLRQSQKLDAIGQLTGGVAHDFNNLLTVILGNADLLTSVLPADSTARTSVQMIAQAATRGAELTQRLLAYARRQALQPVELDLNRIVSGMEPLLARTLGEHIEIEVVRSGGLWRTLADEGQVQSALLNLAVNARDAMPEGGKLTIETANVRLDDDYSADHPDVKPGQYVMLSVTDTGIGMPANVIDRAFDPFFTTKQVGKGTGLGLSMVYGFVKQSGGHVKIYSEEGHGTSIKVYLPRHMGPAATTQRPSPAPDEPMPRGTEAILVVEDDDLVRGSVVVQIKSLGYTVIEASTAAAALNTLAGPAQGIRLLFTDVVLRGGMNGRALASEALKLQPNLQVLFTSGYSENAIVHHGRLDPDINLLSKPYRKADLARKIRAVLDA